MAQNQLLIKNMVCPRCISSVKQILEQLHITYNTINLGEVELKETLTKTKQSQLQNQLAKQGFELIETRLGSIVEKIKLRVNEYLNQPAEKRKKLSTFITEKIPYDYSYLSDLFSSVEGLTIEKYFINQRVEKVKELLVYKQLNLSEIAFQTGYSSSQHLSSQFKKITGLSPSHFKNIGRHRLKGL